MKKILLLVCICTICFTTGCFGKKDGGNYEELKKKVNNASGYKILGILEIVNNDETYKYSVNVGYKKDELYRVNLKNKTNDHEQIILKNENGVFVLTPALNKSFKFQSDWPNNNSQVYLLQALLSDIANDKDKKITKKGEQTIIETKVNYTSNPSLKKQKIYLNKNSDVDKVEVLDSDGNVKIKMTYEDINYKPKFDKNYFEIQKNMETEKTIDTLSEIEDITYPMYIPSNTYLQSQDKVALIDGERVILTFAGEKSFTLIEETANIKDKMEIITTSGSPTMLLDTIGIVDDTSVTWIKNGIEYYAMSDTMDVDELVKVANSISNTAIEK